MSKCLSFVNVGNYKVGSLSGDHPQLRGKLACENSISRLGFSAVASRNTKMNGPVADTRQGPLVKSGIDYTQLRFLSNDTNATVLN